ncbi:hypothetical protein [Bradyrhizobium sp. 145]|uniref:hypothetical protein n=1 Tax=Bradyrhizobium sp. 145 TaxID=2782621 RepID=UPI001FF7B83D|nr:hypothetical protein [Bradyrhizobium sp. 145]MCK1684369.1 hypothetical protein [Bradyrhizobium sp. 145]
MRTPEMPKPATIESRAPEQDQLILDEAVRKRLIAMTVDFNKLWADPDAGLRERKRVLAHIIEDATLNKMSAEGTTKITSASRADGCAGTARESVYRFAERPPMSRWQVPRILHYYCLKPLYQLGERDIFHRAARQALSQRSDLPLKFHPVAVRVSADVTPFGAV